MIFTILYIVFFIYLNFTIYTSLKIGFRENKKHSLISIFGVFTMILFHIFFYLEGLMKGKVLVLLLFFSLGLIILHYMQKLVRMRMDYRLSKINPDLYNSGFYGIFRDTSSFITHTIFPIGITFFQIMVILNTGLQAGMNS